MKKKIVKSVIIPLLFAITLGFYGAHIAYQFYQVKKEIDKRSFNTYAIQYGVYTDEKTLKDKLKELDDYVVSVEDGKYYVYLGFTTDYDNLGKMRRIYKNNDVQVYTKYMYIDNQEFVNSLEQFDVLMANTDKEEDIISVNEAILSSYEEIILGN